MPPYQFARRLAARPRAGGAPPLHPFAGRAYEGGDGMDGPGGTQLAGSDPSFSPTAPASGPRPAPGGMPPWMRGVLDTARGVATRERGMASSSFGPIASDPNQYLSDEMRRSGAEAGAAYDAYAAGRGRVQQRIGEVGDFQPTNLEGYDPNAAAAAGAAAVSRPYDFDPNENLAAFSPTTTMDGSALEDYSPDAGYSPTTSFDSETAQVDTPDVAQYGEGLADFSPTQAVDAYGNSLNNRLKDTLATTIRGVTDQNAAAHRLNTGWFDQDRGEAIQRVAREFSGAAADRAVDVAGMEANYNLSSARTRGDLAATGADLALKRAGTIDAGKLALTEQGNEIGATGARTNAELGIRRAEGIDANTRALVMQGNEIGYGRAGAMDANTMRRGQGIAEAISPFYRGAMEQGYGKAGQIDTMRQRAGETALDAEGRATQGAADYSTRTREYGSEIAAGTLDRQQMAKNAASENRRADWQTGINAAGAVIKGIDTLRGGKGGAGAGGRFANAAAGYGVGEAIQQAGGSNDGTRVAGNIAKGASIGSVIPGVGTIAGGVAGAAYGVAKKPVQKAGRWLKKRLGF